MGRGYINLLEKNVVMHIADFFLKSKIIVTGGRAVLSKEKDISLSLADRLKVADLLEADIWISIHTRWTKTKANAEPERCFIQGRANCFADIFSKKLGEN